MTPRARRAPSPYATILRAPGALRFSTAGLLARFPMSMVGISTILAIQELYGSYEAAGLVSSANVVAAATGAPLLARLVDNHGQRRVMLPATLVSETSLLGLVAASAAHAPLWVLALVAALAGATSGSFGAMVRARWSTLLSTPDQVRTAFSLEAALDEVAFVIGPVLATALCTSSALPAQSGWAMCALLQVVGALWFLSQRRTEPAPRRATASPAGGRGGAVLRNRAVAVIIVVFLFSGIMFGANDVSLVARAAELGARQASGLVLAFFGLGSLVAALVYGSRTWPWPLWRQFLIATTLLAAGASTLLAAHHLVLLAVFMLLTGVTIAPMLTTGNNIVQETVPPDSLTEGLAWVSTAMNIGVSIGSLVGGVILDSHGADGGYVFVTVAAWVAVAAAVAGTPWLRRSQHHRELA